MWRNNVPKLLIERRELLDRKLAHRMTSSEEARLEQVSRRLHAIEERLWPMEACDGQGE
jgi:hypothetical protein